MSTLHFAFYFFGLSFIELAAIVRSVVKRGSDMKVWCFVKFLRMMLSSTSVEVY